MALTEKMKLFAHARLEGKSNKESAIAAGYSARSAGSRGSILAADPAVQSYLDALLLGQGGAGGSVDRDSLLPIISANAAEEAARIADPLDFLQTIWTDPNRPLKERMHAAGLAMPFRHGKVGDIGKKESRQEKAAGISGGSGRFSTLSGQLPS